MRNTKSSTARLIGAEQLNDSKLLLTFNRALKLCPSRYILKKKYVYYKIHCQCGRYLI
jgi:hypothetical protein